MSLEKPKWLRDFLAADWLNFEFLGKEFFIGQAIERAIDWVLGWINVLVDWAVEIGAWWEEFRQEVADLFQLITEEIELFFSDPGGYLKDKFETVILPWAQENIPFFVTLYEWYNNFRKEIELFFSDPGGYLKDKFETVILPWAQENIPFIITLYEWVTNFKEELELFFSDPTGYIRDKLETSEWGDLFTAWEDFKDAFIAFFTDPLEWLWLQFTDWFLGKEE